MPLPSPYKAATLTLRSCYPQGLRLLPSGSEAATLTLCELKGLSNGETPFSNFISCRLFAVFCNLSPYRLLLHRFLATAFRPLRYPPAMRRKANLPNRTYADMRRRELVSKSCNPPADKFRAAVYLSLSKLRNSPHQRPPDDVGTHIFAPQPAIRSAGETPRKNFIFGGDSGKNPAIVLRLADDSGSDGVQDDVPAAAGEVDPALHHG